MFKNKSPSLVSRSTGKSCQNLGSNNKKVGEFAFKFVYQSIPAWDSVGHMGMIAGLEDTFDIMMDIEDVVDFESYTVGIEKLKNYDIEIE